MTKVKICGVKTSSAIQEAIASGADYIGFVFAPSTRQVSIEKAHRLAKKIPETVKKVGVFVSPSLDELRQAIEEVPLDLVQVHGEFDEDLFDNIACQSIRAIQINSHLEKIDTGANYVLFDAPIAGSGKVFDWHLLSGIKIDKPYFIAGGLTEDNVSNAIGLFKPYAVDVSSGVETNGEKDLEKIKNFIESVKK